MSKKVNEERINKLRERYRERIRRGEDISSLADDALFGPILEDSNLIDPARFYLGLAGRFFSCQKLKFSV